MPGDDYGNPHIDVSADHPPTGGEPITEVFVLVATHEDGSEAIYGQVIGPTMTNFVTGDEARKQMLDSLLLQQGTYEVCKRLGKKLEWRTYKLAP